MAKDKRLDAFLDSVNSLGGIPSTCVHYSLSREQAYIYICELLNRKVGCGGQFKICELEDEKSKK